MPKKSAMVIPFSSAKPLIFRFQVEILRGPMTDSFLRKNAAPPSRTIDVSGEQTLDDLHWAIFEAFHREDAHCYQFELGGKKPMDRKASIYSIEECSLDMEGFDASATRIDALALSEGQKMFYWFDFGDDWWHTVTLLATKPATAGKYPCIVESRGESPPQYADWDNMEDEDEEEDFDPHLLAQLQAQLQARKDVIRGLVEDFCRARLNEEYTGACLLLLEEAWKTEVLADRSKVQSWAAGIVQAAAIVNFLYDPQFPPHLPKSDVAAHFGVSSATMTSKGNAILDALQSMPLDPRYCVPSMLKDNPLVQMMNLGMFGTGPNRSFPCKKK